MTSAIERDAPTSGSTNGGAQGQQLQEAATGLVQQAARTADAQASTTMTTAGQALETVATHIRQAGEELRSDQPQVAGFIDTAAERVQGAATYLRDHDASEALGNVQRVARSQPALVIGAGLAAGLVIGRLLRGGAETAASGSSWSDERDRGRGVYDSTGRAAGYGGTGYDTSSYGASSYGGTTTGVSSYGGASAGVRGTAVGGYGSTGDDMLSDSATGDAVRDEAPTARS